MTDALKDLWHTLVVIAPKVALFAAILAVGYFAARIIGRAVLKLLVKVGFNNLLDRAGLTRILGSHYGSDLVGKLAYYTVLLIAAQLAFGVFGPNPISTLITSVIAFLPRLFVALALVIVAATIANAVKTLITNAIGGLSYGKVLATLAYAAIITLGAIAALGQIGVALTVTLPVLIAILATIAGILIVGAGGGLIKPMQARWENYLTDAETEHARHRAE